MNDFLLGILQSMLGGLCVASLLGLNVLLIGILVGGIADWIERRRQKAAQKARGRSAPVNQNDGVNPARELLRAKLLAGGQHKHHAFHAARDGRVLVVDAEAFYFALFARVHDFWKMVAAAHVDRPDAFAFAVQHLERADREGRLTRVNSRCGETYVDAVFPCDLPYVYLATRATAKEFKGTVVERKAEAANRGRRHNGIKHLF